MREEPPAALADANLAAAALLYDMAALQPTERIITEFVTQGSSPTVDAAIAKAGNSRAVQERPQSAAHKGLRYTSDAKRAATLREV